MILPMILTMISVSALWASPAFGQESKPEGNKVFLETTLTGVDGPPNAKCLDGPEGQLLRSSLDQIFESVTGIDIFATASSRPCARALMSYVFELERKNRRRIKLRPRQISGVNRVEVGVHTRMVAPSAKSPMTGALKPADEAPLVVTGEPGKGGFGPGFKSLDSGDSPFGKTLPPTDAYKNTLGKTNPNTATTTAPSTVADSASPTPQPGNSPNTLDSDDPSEPSESSGTKETKPAPSKIQALESSEPPIPLRAERLTVGTSAGYARTENSGDSTNRMGPAAGFQVGLRGLFESVRISAAVDAVRPSSGPATQGLFFEGILEFEPLTNVTKDRSGLLLLAGVRSFASTREEEATNVRRIRPASESTPVLSNSPVFGLGYWFSPGWLNIDARADLAPVIAPKGFGLAYSGSLTLCYALNSWICLGSRAAHQQIKVGAKSGTATFASTAASMWLNLTLD